MSRYIIRNSGDAKSLRLQYEDGDRAYAHTCGFINGDAARRLYRCLRDSSDWGLTLTDGSRILGIPPVAYGGIRSADLEHCHDVAYAAARAGFAFIREELWATGEDRSNECPFTELRSFFDFARGPDFANFFSSVTGCHKPHVVRLTLERYVRGHFLTFTRGAPDDAQYGFSFDLTPNWEIEWGGLTEFADFFGSIESAYSPRFNSLSLYSLSKSRAISYVAPFCPHARYLVVGQVTST